MPKGIMGSDSSRCFSAMAKRKQQSWYFLPWLCEEHLLKFIPDYLSTFSRTLCASFGQSFLKKLRPDTLQHSEYQYRCRSPNAFQFHLRKPYLMHGWSTANSRLVPLARFQWLYRNRNKFTYPSQRPKFPSLSLIFSCFNLTLTFDLTQSHLSVEPRTQALEKCLRTFSEDFSVPKLKQPTTNEKFKIAATQTPRHSSLVVEPGAH